MKMLLHLILTMYLTCLESLYDWLDWIKNDDDDDDDDDDDEYDDDDNNNNLIKTWFQCAFVTRHNHEISKCFCSSIK
jgi:hypothetical protein